MTRMTRDDNRSLYNGRATVEVPRDAEKERDLRRFLPFLKADILASLKSSAFTMHSLLMHTSLLTK